MNARSIIPLVVIAIGVVGYVVTSSPGGKPEGVSQPAPATVAGDFDGSKSALSPGSEENGAVAVKLRQLLENADKTPGAKITPAHLDAFFAKHGRTAANLAAAWEATGDKKWMEAALAEFPDSPLVLFLALAEKNDPRREGWIARLKNSARDNPLPWLFSAEALAVAGKHAEARAELAEALKRPAFYTWFNERTTAAEPLFEVSGFPAGTGIIPAMFGLRIHQGAAAQGVAKSLAAAFPEDASVARQIYDLGKMFQTPEASRLIIGQLIGISLESKGLAAFPEESRQGMKDALNARRDEISTLTGALFKNLNHTKTPELLPDYVRRVKADGEFNALRWFHGQVEREDRGR